MKKKSPIHPRSALQSLTGKYRGLQGNPCNENRDPVMRTGVPCNENRFFPVRIDLQGLGLQCSDATEVLPVQNFWRQQ